MAGVGGGEAKKGDSPRLRSAEVGPVSVEEEDLLHALTKTTSANKQAAATITFRLLLAFTRFMKDSLLLSPPMVNCTVLRRCDERETGRSGAPREHHCELVSSGGTNNRRKFHPKINRIYQLALKKR